MQNILLYKREYQIVGFLNIAGLVFQSGKCGDDVRVPGFQRQRGLEEFSRLRDPIHRKVQVTEIVAGRNMF